MRRRIAGYDEVIELMFIALVANGHVLLEGVPGLAKTTMAKALAEALAVDFKRLQGTPDLKIRDIVGYSHTDEKMVTTVVQGAIFTNILLLDELNRTPAKTTSGFLQALEERLVSIGGQTFELPKPFLAIATQNPLNIEGTLPLPKVLADRFLMRIPVSYTTEEEEKNMLRLKEKDFSAKIEPVVTKEDILVMQASTTGIAMPDEVLNYIVTLSEATRKEMHVVMGASPRAEIAFMQCSKARALIEGRTTITIDDIRFLAKPVLSHRIVVRSTGGIGVGGIIDGMLASIR